MTGIIEEMCGFICDLYGRGVCEDIFVRVAILDMYLCERDVCWRWYESGVS